MLRGQIHCLRKQETSLPLYITEEDISPHRLIGEILIANKLCGKHGCL
jgi:hypothetical protein